MTDHTHSTPRPAPDAPFSSAVSGEPHTEARAVDGVEASARIEQLERELAAEKALADQLYRARMGTIEERHAANAAYRKARGM